jgi:two-component system, NarL family, vancomycin resistance associated response regulator VraR
MLSVKTTVLRVLIADDHELTRFSLKVALQRQLNLELVGIARNGQEAVTIAQETQPDVVILDMQMPVMDGAVASRKIKQLDPQIKIIGYTSLQTADGQNLLAVADLDAICDKSARTQELVELAFQLHVNSAPTY